jgi:hypothetical protein
MAAEAVKTSTSVGRLITIPLSKGELYHVSLVEQRLGVLHGS